jgi:hypothetical protein
MPVGLRSHGGSPAQHLAWRVGNPGALAPHSLHRSLPEAFERASRFEATRSKLQMCRQGSNRAVLYLRLIRQRYG